MPSLRACLRRGVGVTLCPRASIAVDLAAGRLRTLPWAGFEPEPGPPRSTVAEAAVLMIWHAERWCSPALGRFMDLCAEVMGRP